MKKAELEQQNAELKAQLEELQKKEKTMTNNNTADKTAKTNEEFNAMEYVKRLVIRAKLNGSDELRMRQTNQGILKHLVSVGAISSYEIFVKDTFVDEEGKNYVLVKIQDINLAAKAKSKAGKDYDVFFSNLIGDEFKRKLRA